MGRRKTRRFTEADEEEPSAGDSLPQASPPADALALLKWRPGLSGAECKRRAKELKKVHAERRSAAAQSLGRPTSRHPRHRAQQEDEEDKEDEVDVIETCTFVNEKLPPPPALGIAAEDPGQGAEGSRPEPAAPSLIPFDSLPTAVWYRVLSRLDARSACCTMATCSSLRLAAADPHVWEAVQRSTFGLQPHGEVSPTLLESSRESGGHHHDHVIVGSSTAAGNEGFPAEAPAASQHHDSDSPLGLPIFHVRPGLRAGYSRPARSRCCESEASLRRWQNLTLEAPCKAPLPGMTAAALIGGDLGLSIHEQDLGRRTMTRVWDAVTGRRLLSHAMPRGSAALTCCAGAAGRHALVGDERGFVHHFDLDDETTDSGFVPRQSLLVGGYQHHQDHQDEQHQPHQFQNRDDEDGLPPASLWSILVLPASSGREVPVCVACTAGGHLAAWRLGEQEVLWQEAMGAQGIAAAEPADPSHNKSHRQRQHSSLMEAAVNGNSVFVSGTLSRHGDPNGAGTDESASGEDNAMLFDVERRVRTWCGIAGPCYDFQQRNGSFTDTGIDEVLAQQMRGLVLPGPLPHSRTGRRARQTTPAMQQQRLSYSHGWQLLAGIHGGCAHLWDPRCSGRSAMGVVVLPDGMQAGSVFVDQGWGGWPGQLLLGAASGCSVHVFDIRNARRAWLGGGSGAAHLGKFELPPRSQGGGCWTADAGGLMMGSTENTKVATACAYSWRFARRRPDGTRTSSESRGSEGKSSLSSAKKHINRK